MDTVMKQSESSWNVKPYITRTLVLRTRTFLISSVEPTLRLDANPCSEKFRPRELWGKNGLVVFLDQNLRDLYFANVTAMVYLE
jgi:hypothetical protein